MPNTEIVVCQVIFSVHETAILFIPRADILAASQQYSRLPIALHTRSAVTVLGSVCKLPIVVSVYVEHVFVFCILYIL